MRYDVFTSAALLVVLFVVFRLVRGNVQIRRGYAADDRWMYQWMFKLFRKK